MRFVAYKGEVGSKRLMEMVTSSTLNSSEIQAMIDVLLNKQGENSQWKKVRMCKIYFLYYSGTPV